ncbi:hypothetical protein Tco_0196712, partial [Tanacetum coccineum]
KTNDGFQTVGKKKKRKGKSKSTNGGQFTGPSVKHNARYKPKATTSAPKKGTTYVGYTSQSTPMLKTTGNSSKKDNLSMSNSFSAFNEEEEDGENVYDESANLIQNTKAGGSSSFTAAVDQAKEIKLLKAKITKLKKQAKPVIKHHKEYLKIISLQQRFPKKSFSKKQRVHKKNVSKQGRKKAKGESEVHRDPLFDVMQKDKIDHIETENAQSEGRTRDMVDEEKEFDEDRISTEDVVSTVKKRVSTDFEKVSTDRPRVSTDFEKVSTDRPKVSTDEQVEGSEESNESTEEILECNDPLRKGG